MKLFLIALTVCFFLPVSAVAAEYYEIEVAHNDELFIVNGEKFEAKTYCLGWDKGDKEICDVWYE